LNARVETPNPIDIPAGADSVYFLMFSGWDDELRSNRWHYASRWARHLPVVLLQPTRASLRGSEARPEPRIPNCEILEIGSPVPEPGYLRRSLAEAGQVMQHMRTRGHSRPVLWCYNPRLVGLYAAVPALRRVFHVTENFRDFDWLPSSFFVELESAAAISDLVVPVSKGVEASVAPFVSPERLVLVTNGCDGTQYSPDGSKDPELAGAKHGFERTAVYAGNVNKRIDFGLVERAAAANPDTLIAIFGPVSDMGTGDTGAWRRLLRCKNVRYFGAVDPQRLAAIYRTSELGMIPYRRTPSLVRNGFPLKALEMCATGLPTVSSLMEPLVGLAAALVVAGDDESFLDAFSTLGRDSLTEAGRDELAAVCAHNDYDVKFAEILRKIMTVGNAPEPTTQMDLLLSRLGRDSWTSACTTSESRERADVLRARASLAYGGLGARLPARIRHVIPVSVRDRIRDWLAT
jgi:hypothetical protein